MASRRNIDSSFRPRALTAGPPLAMRDRSNWLTLLRSPTSCSARSARACIAFTWTILLWSPSKRRSSARVARRSLAVRRSRGTICARCQRTSCCWTAAISFRNRRLCGWRRRGDVRDAFSTASAARIRSTGSATVIPLTRTANRRGEWQILRATSSDRPVERRSPPASSFRSGCTRCSAHQVSNDSSHLLRHRLARIGTVHVETGNTPVTGCARRPSSRTSRVRSR